MSSSSEHPEPSPSPPASAEPPTPAESTVEPRREKPNVSPTRNAIAKVLLVVLLIVGGLELAAVLRFNNAVERLDQAIEANEGNPLTRAEVEGVLGKQPDAPLVEDIQGRQAAYTWRGALRSHALTVLYASDDETGLVRYEIGPPEALEASGPGESPESSDPSESPESDEPAD